MQLLHVSTARCSWRTSFLCRICPSVRCLLVCSKEVEQNRGSPLQLFCLFAAALLFVVSEGGRGQSLISSAL